MNAQQAQAISPMLAQCWPTVYDFDTVFGQYRAFA